MDDFWARIRSGPKLTLPVHVPGSFQQPPPMWATDAGTLGDPWQMQPGGVAGAKPGDPGWGGSVDYAAPGAAGQSYTPGQNGFPSGSGLGGGRFLQDWIYGGDQLGGGTWSKETGWRAGAPIAAGTDLASLGYATRGGYTLPVG